MPPKVKRKRPGRKLTYPWETWFSRSSFVMTEGADYRGQTHGMIQMMRNQATKRGLSVSVRCTTLAGTDRVVVTVNGPVRGR